MNGGYFPTAWGWSALAFLLVAAAALIVAEHVDLARLDVAFLAGLGALVLWVGLSALWSQSVPRTVMELERGIVYVAGVGAILLLSRRGAAPWISGGLLAAATGVAGYALATRLFPDRFGYELELGYQLARPFGYWNALGIVVGVGILLALGFAACPDPVPRALGAGALPLLVATLYFTFSRGALVALAVGLVVLLAADPRRLRLAATALAVAPLGALAVVLASRSEGLEREQAPLDVAAREGHRLAAAILVLAAGSALVGLFFERVARRVALTPRARRRLSAGLLALAAAPLLAVVIRAGGPVALASRTYDSFRAPLPETSGELQGRLFSVSGNGRADYWRVAVDGYLEHPVLGSGAGTYELRWSRERPTAFDARDAHSLYLETLAELGPIGLVLLVVALSLPFLALPAARRQATGVAAVGGYAAYLAHAALDWDWEVPAVTLAGLACGAAIVVACRGPGDERRLTPALRGAGLALAGVLAAFTFVAYIGNSALSRSTDAAADGHYARAVTEARRAADWMPWASEPWRELGDAQLALGRVPEARESFRKAIAKDPRDWRLWYGLARASEGREATAALAQARMLNPRSPEVAALELG